MAEPSDMEPDEKAQKTAFKSGLRQDRPAFNSLGSKVVQELWKANAHSFINITNQAKGNGKMIWETMNQLPKQDYRPTYRKALILDISLMKSLLLLTTTLLMM